MPPALPFFLPACPTGSWRRVRCLSLCDEQHLLSLFCASGRIHPSLYLLSSFSVCMCSAPLGNFPPSQKNTSTRHGRPAQNALTLLPLWQPVLAGWLQSAHCVPVQILVKASYAVALRQRRLKFRKKGSNIGKRLFKDPFVDRVEIVLGNFNLYFHREQR